MLGDLWYKNAVVYSIDVETFMDSNGDGCGDFEGLSRRLDYLESLGVVFPGEQRSTWTFDRRARERDAIRTRCCAGPFA